jgi:hypothetical protein
MRDEELDRVLSGEREIIPSSGFTVSVMGAVRREAAAPAPIPFPWRRALPGLSVGVLALVSVLVISVTLWVRGAAVQPLPAKMVSEVALMVEIWKTTGGNWIVLALVLSFVSVGLSMRLASGKA